MTKLRSSGEKKKNGIVKLKVAVEKLHRNLLMRKKSSFFEGDEDSASSVPEDVKEGHFAVIAMEGNRAKRFIVPLSFLRNPPFLKLLEQAEEEYGFDHEGALAIPCPPWELERLFDY